MAEKRYDGLLPKVRRYLALKPGDAVAKQLEERLARKYDVPAPPPLPAESVQPAASVGTAESAGGMAWLEGPPSSTAPAKRRPPVRSKRSAPVAVFAIVAVVAVLVVGGAIAAFTLLAGKESPRTASTLTKLPAQPTGKAKGKAAPAEPTDADTDSPVQATPVVSGGQINVFDGNVKTIFYSFDGQQWSEAERLRLNTAGFVFTQGHISQADMTKWQQTGGPVYVKYTDRRGRESKAFELPFDKTYFDTQKSTSEAQKTASDALNKANGMKSEMDDVLRKVNDDIRNSMPHSRR